MNQTGLLSSSVYTATTPNLLPLSARRDAQVPQRSNVKHMQTYTKQARRRSKSVDHYVGERIVIAPELCQICEASKKSRRPEESPTLPWCPHNSYLTNPSITINVTPARSKSFLFKVFILILFTLLMIMILFCQALPFFLPNFISL